METISDRARRLGDPGLPAERRKKEGAVIGTPRGRGACGGDLELGQRSLVLWQLTKIRFANRATCNPTYDNHGLQGSIMPISEVDEAKEIGHHRHCIIE